MVSQQSEQRMMWLLSLLVVGIGSWFVLDHPIVSFLCGAAFVISIMQYVNALAHKAEPQHMARSRVPLYLASILAVFAAFMSWAWLLAAALSLWIYFLLSWLRHIEQRLEQQPQYIPNTAVEAPFASTNPSNTSSAEYQASLPNSLTDWLLGGNLVLKGAILVLVIGVVLLLRFATEHWQISLNLKLAAVAITAAAITAFGVYLSAKNRSFALALQGLGIATLCFTLFFSYYNQILANFAVVSVLFLALMALSIYLSLKQNSRELALMAMLIAYVAPFTLPIRNASATEFLSYYLVVNLVMGVLTTLRPWKVLNQVGFLITLGIAGGYVLLHANDTQQDQIAILVVLHSLLFIWLAFRFSQLLRQQDLQSFSLQPSLDLGLLFGAPLLAYGCLYLIYFEQTMMQAGLSAGYAVLYAVLYVLAKQQQQMGWIKQSYLALSLIFAAFIPAIVLPAEWGVMGWAILGIAMLVIALKRESEIGRYIAMALLAIAGGVAAYYFVELSDVPRTVYWILAACYSAAIIFINMQPHARQQLKSLDVLLLSGLMLVNVVLLQWLVLDALTGPLQSVSTLLILSVGYLIINQVLTYRGATWTWALPKWIGLVPMFAYAFWLLFAHTQAGVIVWDSGFEQGLFCAALLCIAAVCMRPLSALEQDREWISLTTLISLALASSSVLPHMPFVSLVILPLGFALWCAKQSQPWQQFWQARSALVLMAMWMINSQLFEQRSFNAYILPILNPFDAVSLAVLIAFIWMLLQQQKSGLEQGLVGVCSVLGGLWLSSYIMLRALHVYLGTPYNETGIWQDSTVQLSLTLLWAFLALITMQFASRRHLKGIWVLGGSILVLVNLKLVLLDLANIGTLSRVLSFLGAGLIMLIIAYIAPMPSDSK